VGLNIQFLNVRARLMSTSMLVILSILGGIAVALQGQFIGLFGASVRTLDWPRMTGLALLILGAWLVLR
jgi:uncharacterized membrane protein YdcZ (DUF606 family)